MPVKHPTVITLLILWTSHYPIMANRVNPETEASPEDNMSQVCKLLDVWTQTMLSLKSVSDKRGCLSRMWTAEI